MKDHQSDFRNSNQINVNKKNELEYWCEKYNTSPEEIKKAVDTVGVLVKNVEKQLRKKQAV